MHIYLGNTGTINYSILECFISITWRIRNSKTCYLKWCLTNNTWDQIYNVYISSNLVIFIRKKKNWVSAQLPIVLIYISNKII